MSELEKKVAQQALENAKDAVKEKVDTASTSTKLKWLFGIVGTGVLFVAGLALLAKLWVYAIVAVVLAGLGFGTYLIVKPKVSALKAQAEERLLAGKREREAADAAAKAEAAASAKAKKLEDELAALKKKA